MANTGPPRSNGFSSKRKSMRQKQGRRKYNLMKKAREYSTLCEADICVGIRLRETGQAFILSADVSGFWGFLGSQLGSYYPTPYLITDQELEKAEEGIMRKSSEANILA
ncbi:Pc06g02230 [Penicillium rubens Wisconsin 54-1255]|uniref:Pc06g02230 protein n=1 Tax=Penicillium rubens (strain ATCC 28089 / DSM 1075 / NRRL 1951 / Wisconsin 54-1255) TaxID=500485 RepID=B6GWC3_PENRW|nr:Pc06g02230 [Penicillium rubens Wisconsin 54-1255]